MMISSRLYLGVFAPVMLASLGCRATAPRALVSERCGPVWPERLAGRERQVVSDDVIIYANDPANAQELRECIENELAGFRERYDGAPKGPGLVLAIETATALEPVPAVEEWRAAHVDRHGRPYCLDAYAPYFRESFRMPFDAALEARLLEGLDAAPAWVCLLTTDAHRTVAAVAKAKARFSNGGVKTADPSVIPAMLLSAPALPLMYLAHGCLAGVYAVIDADLMHLQRRETLWKAFVHATQSTPEWRKAQLAVLESEIDRTWRDIWRSRPVD